MADSPVVRELFIEELEQVNGGGPIEELLEKVTPGGVSLPDISNTTHACCEEGPDNCC